jgi:hypothetical protein
MFRSRSNHSTAGDAAAASHDSTAQATLTLRHPLGARIDALQTSITRLLALEAKATGPPSPASAFFAGLSGFGPFFNWFFLVLLYALPWLVLGGVVWFGIGYLIRWRRRRAVTPAG